jgi:hypothetical protein
MPSEHKKSLYKTLTPEKILHHSKMFFWIFHIYKIPEATLEISYTCLAGLNMADPQMWGILGKHDIYTSHFPRYQVHKFRKHLLDQPLSYGSESWTTGTDKR